MAVWFGAFSVLWYALLVLALHRQWFSRFGRGFLLTLLISLISTGVGGAALIAVWNYQAASQILTSQTD